MIQKYFYWYFKSALSSRFCDKLIKYSLDKKDQTATTDEFKNKKLTKKRIKDLHINGILLLGIMNVNLSLMY